MMEDIIPHRLNALFSKVAGSKMVVNKPSYSRRMRGNVKMGKQQNERQESTLKLKNIPPIPFLLIHIVLHGTATTYHHQMAPGHYR